MTSQELYGNITLKALKSDDWERHIPTLGRLEQQGLSEASLALGQLNTGKDNKAAIRHFKKGAEKGCSECAWGVASVLGHNYSPNIDGDDEEWFKYCLQAAKGACGDAMNELGNVCNRRKEYLGMFYWYQKAALYEHPDGSDSVSSSLKKWENAGKPKLESCILGVDKETTSRAKIAFDIYTGKRKISPQLVDELMPTVVQGNDDFLPLVLGEIFEQLKIDLSMAKTYYQIAGHNNSPVGMRRIGNMQAYGVGCELDLEKAMGWFTGAAEAGERVAQFVMGQFTKAKNPDLAAYWFMASYRRGYMPALQALMGLSPTQEKRCGWLSSLKKWLIPD